MDLPGVPKSTGIERVPKISKSYQYNTNSTEKYRVNTFESTA